jgi:hypothetical protein
MHLRKDARQWFEVLPGTSPGAAPERSIRYEREGARVTLHLRYQVPGVWLGRPGEVPRLPEGRPPVEVGVPMVPLDVFPVALPNGTTVEPASAEWILLRSVELPGTFDVPLTGLPGVDAHQVRPTHGPGGYDGMQWYPRELGRCATAADADGLKRIAVGVNALAYASSTRRIQVRAHVELRLRGWLAGDGRYATGAVDWRSELVRTVVGARELASSH